ncbi:FxsA family protein [Pseudogemmobacter sp. W21_MBD1_M6]|uniref:FxsA family protein n=1 Tax=Pseudogemmobacter sp. W21_MBD1_M6 TaxID=3240271 RepID=UPI003F95C900
MVLFLIFVAVPLIEIALFIQVGGLLGLWPTLGIVVATALIGTILVRAQGALALNQLRRSFEELKDPTEPLAHGAMILLSGALLVTPGFFTDTLGFLLLFPPVRMAVYKYLRARVQMKSFEMGDRPQARPRADSTVIDAEYEDVTPDKNEPRQPSGWTKH